MADMAGSQMSRRQRINKVVTSGRTAKMHNVSHAQQHPRYHELSSTVQGPCELDTHADTCVAGANCIILEESNQTVNVSAFTDSHEPLTNVPIITAATAYDEESTGTTYILILGQAIYLGNQMKNSLICPNQLRANGLVVEDCPRHLAPRDNPSSHSIFAPEDNLIIPLQLRGVTSYFTTRTPTISEVEHVSGYIYQVTKIGTHIQKYISNRNRIMMTCLNEVITKTGKYTAPKFQTKCLIAL
jgi:hypothetical protein